MSMTECDDCEQCVVCLGRTMTGFKPIARTDDGIICSQKCLNAFMYGANLLSKIKNFAPWICTPRELDVRRA